MLSKLEEYKVLLKFMEAGLAFDEDTSKLSISYFYRKDINQSILHEFMERNSDVLDSIFKNFLRQKIIELKSEVREELKLSFDEINKNY